MAKYTLNIKELAVLRYMNDHLVKDEAVIKSVIDTDETLRVLAMDSQEFENITDRLEANYIVTRLEDGSYVMAQSVYDAINREEPPKDKEDEEITKPFRLNDDTHNYDEDIENEYEEQELKFSDLRAEDPLIEEAEEETLEDEEELEPEETEEPKKKKKKKRRLSIDDFNIEDDVEITDSSTVRPVDKDITVGSVPFAEEMGTFRLNGDSYTDSDIENAYQNQHVDFLDMRGGDVSAIEGEKEPNATEVQHNDSVDTDAGRNIKQSIIDFTAVSSKDNVRKVTETGDTVAVSSILEDNKGPVVSIGKGIVIEGGTFVKDSSISEGFNSYTEEAVDNTDHRVSVYAGTMQKHAESQVMQLFNQGVSSNITSESSIRVSMYRSDNDTGSDPERRHLQFDAIKRVDNEAIGQTQSGSSLNNDSEIHTAKNMTGSVSGKIDYDIASTKLETGTVAADNGFNSAGNAFDNRTQDVERNTDLATARKEANVEMVKNFHTYDFAKLATETGINELKSVSMDITTGIQGSYTDDMVSTITAIAGIGQAIAGQALYGISKFNQAQEDRAFLIAEKLNDAGIDINTVNKIKDTDLKKMLLDNGFTEKDAEILFKKSETVAKEFSYRQKVIKKVKLDPTFLAGNEELREYLKKNGFKSLSAGKQIEILNELNKTNKNAEIRNLDLRKLNKRQLNRLLERRGLDNKSKMILTKTRDLQKKKGIERFTGRHGIGRAFIRTAATLRPSEQDLFGSTVKSATRKVRNTYGKTVIKIRAVQVISDFAKKAYKSGNGFVRVGNKGFEKVGNKTTSSIRKDGLKTFKLTAKGTLKGAATAFTVKSILKAGKERVSDSLYQTESEAEEKKKKEKKEELTNRISGAIDKKKNFEKLSKKVAEKSGKAMKNATKEGFKKAGAEATKIAAKEATKAAATAGAKAAASAGATAGTASAGASAGVAAGESVGAVAIVAIAIVILIIVIILFLMYVFDGFAMAGAEGTKVAQAEIGTLGSDLGEAFGNGIKEIQHTAIVVSDEVTDGDEYVDIKKYLEKIQELDGDREKELLEFANAKIGTYSPESKGLEPYQMNGKYGQDSSILAGHSTQYYGSEDKKNGYTLHYVDAYGNEIANHSTNAKDVMALCAVMFSNQPDDDNVFPYLIEDQWYLMSPRIKWKESDIYCCDTCRYEYNGYDYELTSCKGDNYSSKYTSNGEFITYHCNEYSEVSKIQNLIRQGCKVEGDIRTYNYRGCDQREVSTYFYGDGYDTYDLYLDDYISYDDYRWYVDYYGNDIFSRRFYKYEDYCPGDHKVAVCYGHKDVDIYITIYDKDYAISHNLYPTASTSHTGKYSKYEEYLEDFLDTDKWNDTENVKWVDDLFNQDWYDIYGLDVLGGVGFTIGGSLTDADIDSILENLSEEELSVKQQAILEFALKYVGKIPYYWGGKASSLDFEANHFGTTVTADYKGRTRKGLDCSGFIQWVMANNGIKVPGSTAGYSKYVTTKDHAQLKVGDLGFCNPPGSESNHIGIYAGQDENGNDLWVHCAGSSGTVANNYNGFRYYISLGGL